eukprot:TRINITY_DN27007_c0_g1_i2.p1 TRINITY_DN27007_c0_g1~~TRINITY_DN27007_c0_g1_i2.p1  ORF type:complete len:138 (+),score=15.06 TRINITY_DN27007_c0_g1_i2:134-547(+)
MCIRDRSMPFPCPMTSHGSCRSCQGTGAPPPARYVPTHTQPHNEATCARWPSTLQISRSTQALKGMSSSWVVSGGLRDYCETGAGIAKSTILEFEAECWSPALWGQQAHSQRSWSTQQRAAKHASLLAVLSTSALTF